MVLKRNAGAKWQDHLDVRALFGGDPADLLHGSLLFDLVLFLQATLSFFLGGKNSPSAHYGPGVESRYFYEPGNLPRRHALHGGNRLSHYSVTLPLVIVDLAFALFALKLSSLHLVCEVSEQIQVSSRCSLSLLALQGHILGHRFSIVSPKHFAICTIKVAHLNTSCSN
jgi:hypothetical protein